MWRFIMTIGLCLSCMQTLMAVELLTWDKQPIKIVLSVNEERVIQFPENVKVGFPASIRGLVRHQSAGGAVYWKATEVFEEKRVKVQGIESGRLLLIDLRVVDTPGNTEKIRILLPAEKVGKRDTSKPKTHQANTASTAHEAVAQEATLPLPAMMNPKALTQFAAQQLYAPARLIREQASVQRVSLKSVPTYDLYRGASILATPIASWNGGNWLITAVRLQNMSDNVIALDPRLLRGRWNYATFQHNQVWAAGDVRDTTTVYLISTVPYKDAIHPYGQPVKTPPQETETPNLSLKYED